VTYNGAHKKVAISSATCTYVTNKQFSVNFCMCRRQVPVDGVISNPLLSVNLIHS